MLFRTAFSRLLFLSAILITANATFGQTASFTYQGSLHNNGNAANGQYDFKFALFDAATAGNQIGSPSTKSGTNVAGGLFSVTLNFGAEAFSGADRWLEISAKLSIAPTFTKLSPRQQIASTPYAIQSLNATTATTATTASTATIATNTTLLGGVAANQYVLTADARLSNARQANSVNFNTAELSGVLPISRGGTGALAQNFLDLSSDQTSVGGNKKFTGTVNGTFSGTGSNIIKVSGTLQWQVVSGTSQQAVSNNGYAANNAAQVTITLPVSPSVGDTVRVSGLGAGGWKIVQNAGQTIIGTNLNLFGVSWTPSDSNRNWSSVASSSDGSKMVAVVAGGQIYTSTDSGASWTARDSGRSWQSVASSADGGKLVAVVQNGRIYTSTDSGANWTPRDSNRVWQGVASSADGSKLVAVVFNGQIYTSTDSGVTWTARDSNRQWRSVASSADGSHLVAVVLNGPIYTSIDSGATWTARDSNRKWVAVAASADGNKTVAVVQNGQIYTSDSTTTSGAPGSLVGAQYSAIELQYIGNGLFLPISRVGMINGF